MISAPPSCLGVFHDNEADVFPSLVISGASGLPGFSADKITSNHQAVIEEIKLDYSLMKIDQ